MADLGAVGGLSGSELLDRAGVLHEQQTRAEVEILVLAAQWGLLHGPETIDPEAAGLPGREGVRRFGGEGTPVVGEFSPAVFGARIGRSPWAARELIADALDLQRRFPLLWARVERLEVRVSYARHVVKQCRDLTAEQAGYVDARVAESADGRLPWTRFADLVAGAITAADLEGAREREEQASKARFAKRIRTDRAGMASFLVRADVATITAIDAALTDAADRIQQTTAADTRSGAAATVDERRVAALLHLVTGTEPGHTRQALPQVQLFVHTYAHPDGTGVARIEGHGPVTEDYLRRVLGPQARFRVTPVLDLAGQAPVDAYEVPDKHRAAVHLISPADVFPYASSTSRSMEIDHTRPWKPDAPRGQSRIGNYGPMTRLHHRIKTFGGWQARQPFPGIHLWRDPHGATYLVDNTGTRRLAGAA